MKNFKVTSPAYTGEASLTYNRNGEIIVIDLSETNMNAELKHRFKGAVPVYDGNLGKQFLSPAVVVESEIVITFEMFWEKYDYKFHRDRAEALWKRLSKTDKLLAFYKLDKYHQFLRKSGTQAKLHGDTYLRGRAWENEY
jgi:dienelactone hydrolase